MSLKAVASERLPRSLIKQLRVLRRRDRARICAETAWDRNMSKPQRDETAPSWLNKSFMESILKKGFKNSELEILESEMQMATVVGDNYGSQMFRFNITFKAKSDGAKENISVIAKIIPPGLTGEELRKLSAFEKEEEAFSNVLPAINSLLAKAYPNHKKLCADCYYHQGAPNNLLLLEDLRVSGFVLASRFEGLDMEHSLLVLRSLAKLHAASLVLQKEQPEKLEIFRSTFWNLDNQHAMINFLKTPFNVLANDVLKWSDFDQKEEFSRKLKVIENSILQRVFKVWEVNESKLNVLLHGDSWVNNFMFRYDANGKLSEMNFVDFQLMNLNTPALDLQYFIFTSIAPELRFKKVDLFLQVYHEAFQETLKKLDHHLENPYTLEQLKKDFEEKYFWGLVVFCTIFPLFVVPINEVFHPDEFYASEGKSLQSVYKRENLKLIFQEGLKFFEEKGAFLFE